MPATKTNGNPDRDWRLALAILLYLVCLLFPGLHLAGGDVVEGWRLLLVAWYGFLILEFAWLANVVFIFGLVAHIMKADKAAGFAGIGAFAIGLLSLRSTHWIANHERISHLGLGFYIWMAAFIVLATYLYDGFNTSKPLETQDDEGGR